MYKYGRATYGVNSEGVEMRCVRGQTNLLSSCTSDHRRSSAGSDSEEGHCVDVAVQNKANDEVDCLCIPNTLWAEAFIAAVRVENPIPHHIGSFKEYSVSVRNDDLSCSRDVPVSLHSRVVIQTCW